MVSSQAVLSLTVICAFSFGLVMVLLSNMRPQLADHLRLSEGQVGNLWAALNFVLVPMTFFAGILIDVAGIRPVILVGSLLSGFAFLILRAGGGYRRAMIAYLLTAAGGAAVGCSAIVLMPRAFFGTGESSASLNMGNVFFALGALVAPALADVLLRGLGLLRTLVILAVGSLLPALLVLLIDASELPTAQSSDLLSLLTYEWVWLAGVVFFFYAPLEGCLHTWGASYLTHMGHDEKEVSRLISAFWSAFLLGRLGMAYLQHLRIFPEEWSPYIVLVLSLGATVMIGNLAGTVKKASSTLGLLMLGLFLGPIFPTLVGTMFRKYPAGHGTVFGTLFAIGSAGSLVFAPIIGSRFKRTNAQGALRIPLILGLLLMISALVFGFWLGSEGGVPGR
jgi:fucose permease